MRWFLHGILILGAAYTAFFAAVLLAMLQPPERFGRIVKHVPTSLVWGVLPGPRMWLWARRGDLAEGGQAPDFALWTQDRANRIALSSHRGRRPVVLVFGSYT